MSKRTKDLKFDGFPQNKENKPIERRDLGLEEEAYVLYNVLSPEQCQWIIASTEALGYDEKVMWEERPPFRKNTRVIVQSEPLVEWLWERIAPHLPGQVELSAGDRFVDGSLVGGGYPPGRWAGHGVNNFLRCCKYEPGGVFSAHYDGNHVRDDHERSMYTFMIYLNDGYEGGTTNFLRQRTAPGEDDGLDDSATGPEYGVVEVLTPRQGMAVVFRHTLWHEGAPLVSGIKYIIRTDVLFTLQEPLAPVHPRHSPPEHRKAEAERLWKLAEDLERSGQLRKAAAAYSRAEVFWPEISLLPLDSPAE